MDLGNYTENHHVFIIFIQGRKFVIHKVDYCTRTSSLDTQIYFRKVNNFAKLKGTKMAYNIIKLSTKYLQ